MGSGTSGLSDATGTSSRSSGSSHGTGTSQGERDGSTTDEVLDSSGRTEPATLYLFASTAVTGEFAGLGTLPESGLARCNLALQNATPELECAETFAIIGSNLFSLAGLRDDHPELDTHVFEGPDGAWLADSYDAILDGDVSEEFNASVFSVNGGNPEQVFWWGGGDVPTSDCQGWGVGFGEGDARRFQLAGPVDDGRQCNNVAHLLCACLPLDE